MKSTGLSLGVLAVLVVGVAFGAAATGSGLGRDALRAVVAICAASQSTVGTPFPCTSVIPGAPGTDGYVVLHTPRFSSEFLLSPLLAMDGIESPDLQADAATGLWQAAWGIRAKVVAAHGSPLGRPLGRNDIGLAVNSGGTRTQDQFHIHVDCVAKSVREALVQTIGQIGETWQKFPQRLRGEHYWVRTLPGVDLVGVNIARLISVAPPARAEALSKTTLAVLPVTMKDGEQGFYLLANWENSSAERLLDHQCRGL